ncbi:MAG: hypothetical protein QQN63_10910 [Nitrosopumilus sp.]
MLSQITSIEDNRILNTGVEDLANYFEQEYKIDIPRIDEENIEVDYGDAKINVAGRFDYLTLDDGTPVYVTGTRVSFYLPFEGDADLFRCKPSTFNSNPPRGRVAGNKIVLTYERTDQDAAQFKSDFDRDLSNIQQYLGWIARDVESFNSSVNSKAKQTIEARREKLLKDQGLAAAFGFSLKRMDGAPKTYVVPTQRRKVPARMPEASSEPVVPEPTLDMQEYEQILSIISNMVSVM